MPTAWPPRSIAPLHLYAQLRRAGVTRQRARIAGAGAHRGRAGGRPGAGTQGVRPGPAAGARAGPEQGFRVGAVIRRGYEQHAESRRSSSGRPVGCRLSARGFIQAGVVGWGIRYLIRMGERREQHHTARHDEPMEALRQHDEAFRALIERTAPQPTERA